MLRDISKGQDQYVNMQDIDQWNQCENLATKQSFEFKICTNRDRKKNNYIKKKTTKQFATYFMDFVDYACGCVSILRKLHFIRQEIVLSIVSLKFVFNLLKLAQYTLQ